MAATELEISTSKLFWVQWLSAGLSLACLLASLEDLFLRNPLPVVLWLLGSGVLAIGRLLARQAGAAEQPWLKAFILCLVLAGPWLFWWASTANDDITFRDEQNTIRQQRTLSMDPKEEEIETRHYRTVDALFEVPVGTVERRPVQQGEQIGY